MTGALAIRKAIPDDLPCLQAFEQAIVAAERPLDARLRDQGVHYYDLAAMLDSASVEVVLAFAESRPIGCGLARVEDAKPYLRHREDAYLGLMFVDPTFRGRGVNQLILDHLTRWCRSKGVSELRLEVYAANQPARRAYEKAGFQNGMLEMRMTLPDEPA